MGKIFKAITAFAENLCTTILIVLFFVAYAAVLASVPCFVVFLILRAAELISWDWFYICLPLICGAGACLIVGGIRQLTKYID